MKPTTTHQVAPGWQRVTDDAGRAQYRQAVAAEPGYSLARPLDVQRIAENALAANGAMVSDLLRHFAPVSMLVLVHTTCAMTGQHRLQPAGRMFSH